MVFLDIGKYSINLDHITAIYRSALHEVVTIELDVLDGDNARSIDFFDDESIAFKKFWKHGSRKLSSGQNLIIYEVI